MSTQKIDLNKLDKEFQDLCREGRRRNHNAPAKRRVLRDAEIIVQATKAEERLVGMMRNGISADSLYAAKVLIGGHRCLMEVLVFLISLHIKPGKEPTDVELEILRLSRMCILLLDKLLNPRDKRLAGQVKELAKEMR